MIAFVLIAFTDPAPPSVLVSRYTSQVQLRGKDQMSGDSNYIPAPSGFIFDNSTYIIHRSITMTTNNEMLIFLSAYCV